MSCLQAVCQADMCLGLGDIAVTLIESLKSSLHDEISWHNNREIKNTCFHAGSAHLAVDTKKHL